MNDDSVTPAASRPAAADSPGAESPPPPRRKGCGCWTVSLTTIAAAVMLVAGVYVLWRWSNARALERMIAIAKEKGEPTTWEELAATQPTSPEIERTTKLWMEAAEKANPPFSVNDMIDVAFVGPMGQEGTESRKAMDRFMETGVMPLRIREASKVYLQKRSAAVELSHAARRSGTLARFPLTFEVGEEAHRESIQSRRHLANVLCLDLAVRRADGATEGFGENHLTLLALVESDRESADRLRQLVRIALLVIAREQLLKGLERDELSTDELRELQLAWAKVDLQSGLRSLVLHAQIEAFRDLSKTDFPPLQHGLRPCPDEDAYEAARMLRSLADRSDDFVTFESALAQADEQWNAICQGPFAEYRFEGCGILLVSATFESQVLRIQQSFVDSFVAALACERFRRDRGDWPERLDELVPYYLDALPPDRWDGGMLKYAKSDGELRIYSVGDDRNDDGGEIHDNYLATPADYGVRLRRSSPFKEPAPAN